MSTEAEAPQPIPARRAPMVLGIALIGLGGSAALAAQTGLSLAQSSSIAILVCALLLLSFMIDRARVGARIERS